MKEGTKKFLKLKEEYTFKHLFDIIAQHGKKIAIEYQKQGKIKQVTYNELIEKSLKTANRLHELLGDKYKDCFIGLHLDNCAEWLYIFWGLLKAGYNPIFLDFRAQKDNLLHLLKNSGSKAIITNEKQNIKGDILQINKEDIFNDLDNVKPAANLSWATKVAFCTSGTISTSKIFVYKETALLNNVASGWQSYEKSRYMLQTNSKILAFLPFYHIFGLFGIVFWPTLCGNIIVFLEDRSPRNLLKTCKEHKITDIYGVPVLWNNLANKILAKIRQESYITQIFFSLMSKFSLAIQHITPYYGAKFARCVLFRKLHKNLLGLHIEGLLSGGAYLSPSTLKILTSLGFPTSCGYGMTEAGIVSAEVDKGLKKRLNNSLGKVFPSIETKLVPFDQNSSNKLAQIYLRGDTLHTGRLENGQLMPAVRDKEGWFKTGDLGKIVDGYLYLHGRCKDVIINESGENVYPDELEDYFRDIEGIEHFCIVGIKTSQHKEHIYLVLYANKLINDINFRNAISYRVFKINNKLPVYKRINKLVLSKEPLPITTNMKVQRHKLKRIIEENNLSYIPLKIAKQKHSHSNSKTQNSYTKLKEEVRKIFAEVLGVPVESINDQAHFVEDLGGDSLQAIELATVLETKYKIFISDSDLLQCTNVEDLLEVVSRQLNQKERKDEQLKEIKTKSKRLPITNFEDTKEYKQFFKQIQAAGDFNPYFVKHDSVVKDTSMINNTEVINLASYNYLGLSGHPEVTNAAKDAIEKYGTSASGSRLLTGEKSLYLELEKELAEWKGTEDAVVLVSGHATNVTFVGNFCSQNDLIIYDALSHNSIDQGCRLSKADSKAFPHNDYKSLEKLLEQNREYYEKVLIIIEGVYSMDGDIAPVPEFVRLKKEHDAFLMVDEAHSTCVLGDNGKGVKEYFNLKQDDVDIYMGTLSKGFGSCGGYLAGKKSLIQYLRYNLPGFVFSVGINPGSAAAALASLRLIKKDNSMVKKLHNNIDCFLREAHKRNFNTCLAQKTAIIPILIGKEETAFYLSKKLQENGIAVPPAVYPSVPKGKARLRFCVTSDHRKEQIVKAMDLLNEIAQKDCIKLPAPEPEKKLA